MKIYHYTSIESLYLILKNKTMRFSTLSNVDDMDEGLTQEFNHAQQYLFVSCWTEEEKESIPQWAVYSKNMEGIRIGIEIERDNPRKIFELVKDSRTNMLISEDLDIMKNFPLVASPGTPFYREMKYTNDSNDLKPNILSYDEKTIKIDMSKVALYKSSEWSFQKESRFVIDFSASPFNADRTSNKKFDLINSLKNKNLPFEYKDIKLADTFFENIEITFGPKCPKVHKEIVEMYLKNFNVDASLNDSYLNIR
ncbi:DUF2971 domain-containing protein [Marinilactibacillus psychrotolerans]|uniref:DUF2971 domain-containing protein n=1 Tax=Marinilactibacillus psychrotolerans TaxID=191770 RepID=UPI0039B1133F